MCNLVRVAGLVLGLCGFVSGQSHLRFKTQSASARSGADDSGRLTESANSTDSEAREHFILEMSTPITPELVQSLQERGVRVLAYVPDTGVSVSIKATVSLLDLPVIWAGKLEPEQKLSPTLGRAKQLYAIVEFHSDVDTSVMREVADERDVEILNRLGLLPSQLLVRSNEQALMRLAGNDAVSYIFRASSDIIAGRPIAACSSGLTSAGRMAPYTATYGNGWEHSSAISYTFGPITWKLPTDFARQEVLRALNEWAKYIQIGLWENSNRNARRNIDISFLSGNHGDGMAFDGPGGILAHTFYPAPPNPESIAGDMHLDADENWGVASEPDLFSLALHEAGHALGVGHSDDPNDVMYAFYKHVTGLTPHDVATVRTLYYAKPDPALTLKASSTPDTVTDSTLPLAGTVDGGLGAVRVSWYVNDQAQGTADGSRQWSVASIPLVAGPNTIQLTATDGDGNAATLMVTVYYDSSVGPGSLNTGGHKHPKGGKYGGLLQREIH